MGSCKANCRCWCCAREDLDALPDDPDDLEADSVAPRRTFSRTTGGKPDFIDGFSGGRLPPKESDSRDSHQPQTLLGGVRQTLLPPYSDFTSNRGRNKLHGQGMYSISDNVWNARNPLVALSIRLPIPAVYGMSADHSAGMLRAFFIDGAAFDQR